MSRYESLKETKSKDKQKLVSTENPGQKTCWKFKKSSKTGQDQKTLISSFCVILGHLCQKLVSEGETEHWAGSYPITNFFYYL